MRELGVMKALVILATVTGFNFYPGFLENSDNIVEAVIDKQLIDELIINCQGSTGIMSYDKIERVYCLPRGGCTADLDTAIDRLCSGR